MVEKVRKESEPGRELYAEDFFLSALRCLLSAGQTRERERRASDVAACISAILAVDGEAATLEKRRGCDRVNAEAGRAWALAGPDRGGGGGGGNGCTADGLVATPRWLSPFHTRGAGPLPRRPWGSGPLLGLAGPRLRCVLWPEALRAWGPL